MRGPTKPAPILDTLRRHRPTVFFSVPALFGALVPRARQPTTRWTRSGSASRRRSRCPRRRSHRWRERFGLDIVDGIGSTEMLHIYCSNRPGQIEPGNHRLAGPGLRAAARRRRGEPVEGPGIGALQVRGDSCAAFYWHQHEKTKASMLGDWFATGDRYERAADGTYAYVGPGRRHAQGGRPVGVAGRHGARADGAPPRRRGRRRRRHASTRPAAIAAYVECAGRAGRRRARRRVARVVQGADAPLRVPAPGARSSTTSRAR